MLERTSRFSGVVLFVDVAGFTPMSEALAAFGRAGTEELTGILNDYFGPTIEHLSSFGGDVVAFGGDALTVVFRYGPADAAATACDAVRCALELQAAMVRYTSMPTRAGTFSLTTKIGVAAGDVVATVGGGDEQMVTATAGDPLDHSAEAEHHGGPGEVVLHESVLALAPGIRIDERRGAFSTVREQPPRCRRPPAGPEEALPAPEVLRRLVHPVVARRLDRDGFVEEHRKVTTLFVGLDIAGYHDDATVASLRSYIGRVVPVIDRHGGYLAKVLAGDKGSMCHVVFGTPMAHDDDECRALACALELRGLPGPRVRVGAATAVAWCGLIGSQERRTYDVMGDGVNLAARLMQAARWGDVLADRVTLHPAARRFRCSEPRSVPVKGKAAAVEAGTVDALLDAPAPHLHEPTTERPLVGRSEELRWAEGALADARAGRGRVLGLCAEAGIGKSRLAAAVAGLAREQGMAVHGGAFESYGTRASYYGWREVWWSLIGADRGLRGEALAAQLADLAATMGANLGPQVPLLAPVLGDELDDNDFTAPLAPELRAELLRSLLLAFLQGRAAEGPMLVVLEDCHWMDGPSQELLDHLGRYLAVLPVAVLTLYRPPSGAGSPLRRLVGAPHVGERELGELGAGEARALVRQHCADTFGEEPTDAFVDAVVAKAEGNPLFIGEIVGLFAADGSDPSTFGPEAELVLPDTLASVVLARIDKLADDEQQALKVASVVGRVFTPTVLAGAHPALGTVDEVRQHVEALRQRDLTPLEALEPEPAYVFRHVTIQEVAYESLTFRTREALHEAVGDHLERTTVGSTAGVVDLLAHHYSHSANRAKQRRYLELAGDAAKAAFSNDAALDYFRRLTPLLEGDDRAKLTLRLGEVLEHVGRPREAGDRYREVLATPSAALRVRGMCALGRVAAVEGRVEEAADWLEQAESAAEVLGDEPALAGVLDALCRLQYQRADFAAGMATARRYLQVARSTGDRAEIARALHALGFTETRLGDLAAAAEHLEESFDVTWSAGDRRGAVEVATDLAVLHGTRGDMRQALEWLQRADQLAAQVGYLKARAMAVANMGEAARLLGHHEEALGCSWRAIELFLEIGDTFGVLGQLSIVGLVLAAQGDRRRAGDVLERAVALAHGLGRTAALTEALHGLARVRADEGRLAEAIALNQQALEEAESIGIDEDILVAQLFAIRLEALVPGADTAGLVDRLRQLLVDRPDPEQQAAIHYELWRVAGVEDSRREAARLYGACWRDAPVLRTLERYRKLTGETLGDLPAFPSVVEVEAAPPLDDLLERLDALGMGAPA